MVYEETREPWVRALGDGTMCRQLGQPFCGKTRLALDLARSQVNRARETLLGGCQPACIYDCGLPSRQP
jgi:hypothetical protein